MIIVRSPLRISLGGGGTDLPSYYREHDGFLIAAAIDKYVYITLQQTFVEEFIIKYSKLERVQSIADIEHPIIREALKLIGLSTQALEITSMADIPAGTGLGSSGSFTTALLKGLHILKKNLIQPEDLAKQACHLELNLLNEPIGKQDQYIAAYGGICCLRFLTNDQVEVLPLNIQQETLFNLEDNLLLFFTGVTRSASRILKEQDNKCKKQDAEMFANLHFIKELAFKKREALEKGNLIEFAQLMNVHWEYKKQRAKNMSNPQIEAWYQLARNHGAMGGKLIGAGGGGFLMFYSEDKTQLRKAMHQAGLKEVRFRFDFAGTQVITQS